MRRLSITIVVVGALARVAHPTETSVPFIHADAVHAQGVWGDGVTVAVVDTGVDRLPLGGRVVGGVTIRNGVPRNDGGPVSSNYHGTQVALVIAAVAPGAKIFSVRVSDRPSGVGLLGNEEAGLRYVTDLHLADRTLRVINYSRGSTGSLDCPCESEPFGALFVDALDGGIVSFVCAGNGEGTVDRCSGPWPPACLPCVVPVAASYDDRYGPTWDPLFQCGDLVSRPYWVTCFSQLGPNCCNVIAAPGWDITVAPGLWEHLNGTSFATPHCAGVAALMFSKNGCGSLNAYDVRQIIYNTATEYDWAEPDCPADPRPRHLNALAAVNAVPGPVVSLYGDLDCDGLVSGYDFPWFEGCMTGPAAQYPDISCVRADFPESRTDGDGHVDLRDLYHFQLSMGPMGSGACCHTDGTCSITTVYDCLAETGAVYNGHDSTCPQTGCIVPRYINTADPGDFYFPAGTALLPPGNVEGHRLADDITLADDPNHPHGLGGFLTGYGVRLCGGDPNSAGTFDATVQFYSGCPGDGGTPILGTDHTFYDNPDNALLDLWADLPAPVYIPHRVWMVIDFSTADAGWVLGEQPELGDSGWRVGGVYASDPNDPTTATWICWLGFAEHYPAFWAVLECALCQGADCTADRYSNWGDPWGNSYIFHPVTVVADDIHLVPSGPPNLIHYDVLVGSLPDGDPYDVTASLHTGCPPDPNNKIAGTEHSWSNLPSGQLHTLNADFPSVWVPNDLWMQLRFSDPNTLSDPNTIAGWIWAWGAEIGRTYDYHADGDPNDPNNWSCNQYFCDISGFWANLTFGTARDAPPAPVTSVQSAVPPISPAALSPRTPVADARPLSEEPGLHLASADPTHVPFNTTRAPARAPARASRSGTVTLYLTSSVAGRTISPYTRMDWAISAEVSPAGNSGLALLSTDLVPDANNPPLFDLPEPIYAGPGMGPFRRPGGITNPDPNDGWGFGGTPVGTPGAMNLVQIGGCQNTFGIPGVDAGLQTTVTPGIGQSGPTMIVSSESFWPPQSPGTYTFRLENAFATLLDSVSPPPTPPAYWPVSPAAVDLTNGSFSFTVRLPATCQGDMNCDGSVTFADIDLFVQALAGESAWNQNQPGCPWLNADCNGDENVTFADIDPFVALIGTTCS